jgi:hypothetical protein
MIPLALLLLLAPPTRVTLVDEAYLIPAEEWRYVDVPVEQPALVCADVRVRSESGAVGLALLDAGELENLKSEKPFAALAATQAMPEAGLRYHVKELDKYMVLVDNRAGRSPAAVHLRVWLELPPVTTLPRARQLWVIGLSFAVFFGIVTWSARRLLRNLSHPPGKPSPLDTPGC